MQCENLKAIEISADNPVFETVDGVLFDKKEHTLISYPIGLTAASYVVPEGVTVIGKSAFSECKNLTGVTLPGGLTSIAEWAFYDTGLTAVEIPEGVKTIGYEAFGLTKNMTRPTLPESLTFIDDWAFAGSGLTSINVIAGSYAEEWVMGNGYACHYR